MDGEEGEMHPFWGAEVLAWVETNVTFLERCWPDPPGWSPTWWAFCVCHSRFTAKRLGLSYSSLCVADKYVTVIEPWWLYGPRVRLSGELQEYISKSDAKEGDKYALMHIYNAEPKVWYANVQLYLKGWVAAHKDGSLDTWTPDS